MQPLGCCAQPENFDNCVTAGARSAQQLRDGEGVQRTSVGEVTILLLRAGLALLKVLVFHFNKLDHVGGLCRFLVRW